VSQELKFAAAFPAGSQETWLKLVDKVLAGADFEKKLVSRTYDGLAIQPLYTRADWKSAGDPSGFPGGAPFTRGGTALGTARGWDVRQSVGHADPAVANRLILEELEKGATSILLNNNPANGVQIDTLADLEIVLKDVLLDIAPVSLGAGGPPAAAMLMALIEKQGVAKSFAGNFGLDAFASLAVRGFLPTDIATSLARMADMAAYVSATYPNAQTFNVRAYFYHGAGASEAQELGSAVAVALEYVRAMTAAGLDVNAAFKQISFTVAADADFFLTVAKIRALRKIWARVAEVCGATASNVHIAAITAGRMMSRRDPWVNVLRTTVACFAAGVAGADAITVLPFDLFLGVPSDLGRRIARNMQIVLQEESSLAKVIDPAGGAYMFEHLTDQIADKAWAFFQDIERQGGMSKALPGGFVAEKIAAVHAERMKNVDRRKDSLTGVSAFPDIHEKKPDNARPAAPKEAPAARGTVAALPAASNGALTKVLVAAAAGGANVAAISAAMGGTKTSMTPLPQVRTAEGFENLRDAGDAFKAEYGQNAKIFVANVGNVAEFTDRATFAKNFFESGGIEAVGGAGGKDVAAIVNEFRKTAASFAIICSSDKVYSELAPQVATALKEAGAAAVYLAGRGGDNEAALKSAGIDTFIYVGCDVRSVLEQMHQRLKAGK
jgi:methylmalonyl-CoA mutase